MANKKQVPKIPFLDKYFAAIDREIYLCDNPDELGLLASTMLARACDIINTIAGPEKTKFILHMALDELNNDFPSEGQQYDKRTSKRPPKKGSNL